MAESMTGGFPTTKHAGIALMAAVVVTILAGIGLSGALLADTPDPERFSEWQTALEGGTRWILIMAMVSIYGLVLYIFAGLFFLRLPAMGGPVSTALLRFGALVSIVEWTAMILNYAALHVTAEYVEMSGSEAMATATAAHSVQLAAITLFMLLMPIGSALLGLGLARRFDSWNAYRVASWVLVLVGVVGFINYILTPHFDLFPFLAHIGVMSIALTVGAIAFFVIGLGMYKGADGLTADDA